MATLQPSAFANGDEPQPIENSSHGWNSGSGGKDGSTMVRSSSTNQHVKWHIRDIDWRFVIRSQLWATALITLIPVVMLGVVHWAIHPRQRPFAIYDATISYPNRADTIPAWVAIVVPFILMIISLWIGEFILFKKVHPNVTMAVSTALHFFIDMVVAFLFTIFMTELTKVATGVLRPDFLELAQCQPLSPVSLGSEPLVIGQSGNAAKVAFPCRASDKTVRDARQAFVSGHASTATVFAFYHCGYFLWTLFYRNRRSVMSHVVRRRGKTGVFLKDLGQAAGMYWVLVQICFGWGIGISRIIDNKHSTADVVGGFLLGAMIGLAFVMKAIPTAKYVTGRGPEFNMAHSFDHCHGFLERPSDAYPHARAPASPRGGQKPATVQEGPANDFQAIQMV